MSNQNETGWESSPAPPCAPRPKDNRGGYIAILIFMIVPFVGWMTVKVKEDAAREAETAAAQVEMAATSESTWESLRATTSNLLDESIDPESVSKQAKALDNAKLGLEKLLDVCTFNAFPGSREIHDQIDNLLVRIALEGADIRTADNILNGVVNIPASLKLANTSIKAKRWIQADTQLTRTLKTVDELESASDELKDQYLPKDFKLAKQKRTAERLQKSIAKRVEDAQWEAGQKKIYAARCKGPPDLLPMSSVPIGLTSAIKHRANDPSSIDVLGCTKATLTEKHCWEFSCNVRGRNGFGALMLSSQTFNYSGITGFE